MLDTSSKSQRPVADSYQQVVGKSFKFVLAESVSALSVMLMMGGTSLAYFLAGFMASF
jgi:hypothetical protein